MKAYKIHCSYQKDGHDMEYFGQSADDFEEAKFEALHIQHILKEQGVLDHDPVIVTNTHTGQQWRVVAVAVSVNQN